MARTIWSSSCWDLNWSRSMGKHKTFLYALMWQHLPFAKCVKLALCLPKFVFSSGRNPLEKYSTENTNHSSNMGFEVGGTSVAPMRLYVDLLCWKSSLRFQIFIPPRKLADSGYNVFAILLKIEIMCFSFWRCFCLSSCLCLCWTVNHVKQFTFWKKEFLN